MHLIVELDVIRLMKEMFKKQIFLSFLLVAISIGAKAQGDSTPKMLLANLEIQIQSTEAVNSMYNFKFKKAEADFLELKKKYPNHPIAYFLMSLSNWWKMIPNTDIEVYDKTFLAYIDSTIYFADQMYKADEKDPEAAFFLAAAYGLQGEFYGTRKKYMKAASSTKDALTHLKMTSENTHMSPEFLYGTAVMNYYRTWLREEYPLLTPFLIWFPGGDKALGIKQLKEVSYTAFYSRVEAQYQLLKIYDLEDSTRNALPVARYLNSLYPDNAWFARKYAQLSYQLGDYNESKRVSHDILEKLENNLPGFEETSGRYAGYFLGRMYHNERKLDSAKVYYKKAMEYAEISGDTDQGYYLWSVDGLAEIAEAEGDYKLARKYYQTVAKAGKKKYRKHDVVEDAADKVKELKGK